MHLLLTGAEGFTGRHLAQAARGAGYEVHALQADLTDAAKLAQEVAAVGPTHVVHLAAISAVTHADELAFYRVNVLGTDHLLKALAALPEPPRKVLLASSANVYGNTEQSPITEQQPPAPVNHYAISKLAMEHVARMHAARLPVVLVRPFNYTGVGHDERFVLPKLVSHFARRAPHIELGNLNVEREFNDVRMVTQAYLRLLANAPAGETYNVCTGQPVALQTAIQMLVALTGHSPAITMNPAFVRSNEIQRLCGSPEKLVGAIGPLPHYTLKDTLTWMLGAASATA
jgi:nucleoside-diphosphate-sugar epimerase